MNAKEKLAEVKGYVKALYDVKSFKVELDPNASMLVEKSLHEIECLLNVINDTEEE